MTGALAGGLTPLIFNIPILILVGSALALIGLAGIFVILFRKMPILAKLEELPATDSTPLAESLKMKLKGIKYSSYRPLLLEWFEKSLRKIRVGIWKLDNFFNSLIKNSREKAQIWTIRSKAWIEYSRLKKKQKLQVLEKLDKVQVSETLEKNNQEVAKEEDQALKEKIAVFKDEIAQPEDEANGASEIVGEEEKKYIDQIAENPKSQEAYRHLGFIYLQRKNYSDARACFRRVLKLDPQNADIQAKLDEIRGLRSKKNQLEK